MAWLKTNAPIFFSPTFWGYTTSALFGIAELYEWFRPELMAIIMVWIGGVTTVNVIWKGAKKMAGN